MRPAGEAERASLHRTFSQLCAIPSPFGSEAACGRRVTRELESMGLAVEEDASGRKAGGECGNLLARIPGRGERTLLLCAHLDTVALAADVEPRLQDGFWVNANDGILGADNKAAVAVMLEVARRCAAEPGPVGVELLLTVCEENALAGAKAFDVAALGSDYGYVFDHASPIGEIVQASPTYFRVEAAFAGTAAHAGIRPQDGRSAIVAAAAAIAAMSLGRIDEETTANIGLIDGGSASTNVVAEACRVEAETRSLSDEKVEASLAEIVDRLHEGASAAECDVDIVVEKKFQGYRTRASAPAIRAAQAALAACGHEPRLIDTGGGSDANAFEAAGLSCVNLANGTERNHQPDERVSAAALDGMLDVAFALLDAAAEC